MSIENYKMAISSIKQSLENIQQYILVPNDKKEDETKDIDNLYRRLDLVENSLESILNWLRLQKNVLKSIQNLTQWLSSMEDEQDLNIIRHKLRMLINPQAESFGQNLETAQKSSVLVIKAIDKQIFDELTSLMSELKEKNMLILTSIGFDPSINSSDLVSAIENLIMGDFTRSKEILTKIDSRITKTQNL